MRRGKEPVDVGANEKCDRGRMPMKREWRRKKESGQYRKRGEAKGRDRS